MKLKRGNKLKITPPRTSDPSPSPKSGRKYGSPGIDRMSWEENQGTVMEVREHNGGYYEENNSSKLESIFRTGRKKK